VKISIIAGSSGIKIPVKLYRYDERMMVRRALTPEAVERGRRLGAHLRRARGDRSITDVAAAAGVSPETLRKIETGRLATPSFATVAAVATSLGLSLDTLAADAMLADIATTA
jgi:DNA-binding phage protein